MSLKVGGILIDEFVTDVHFLLHLRLEYPIDLVVLVQSAGYEIRLAYVETLYDLRSPGSAHRLEVDSRASASVVRTT